MVARGADGETRVFPVVETVHRDSICWVTEAPAHVPADVAAAAAQLAEAAVKALAGGQRGRRMPLQGRPLSKDASSHGVQAAIAWWNTCC